MDKETEGFLNADKIKRIKSGSIVVNLSPNELVDFNALEKRLAKNDIIYISDHTDEMAPELIKRLKQFPNVRLYPPIGYQTREATLRKQEIFVNNFSRLLNRKPF